MAAENKLLLFNVGGLNILTDTELDATNWDSSGIVVNEVADSDKLNSLFRQITTVTQPLAGLVATELDLKIGSYDDLGASVVTVTQARIKSTLEAVTLQFATDKRTLRAANTVWAGPVTGTSIAPVFRALVAADIPSLATSKITSGTFVAAFLATDSVETVKIKDLNVTATKLASNAVETAKIKDKNITFAKLLDSVAAGLSVIGRNINSAGAFAEIAADTDHYVLRRSGTALAFGQVASAGLADNAVINSKINSQSVSKDKLSRSTILDAAGTYLLDSFISPKHSSVVGKIGVTTTDAAYTIRKVTQAEYTAVTKEANTIYIIQD